MNDRNGRTLNVGSTVIMTAGRFYEAVARVKSIDPVAGIAVEMDQEGGGIICSMFHTAGEMLVLTEEELANAHFR